MYIHIHSRNDTYVDSLTIYCSSYTPVLLNLQEHNHKETFSCCLNAACSCIGNAEATLREALGASQLLDNMSKV